MLTLHPQADRICRFIRFWKLPIWSTIY